MLPFLKLQQEGSMSGPIQSEVRKPDESSFDIIDSIVEDFHRAFSSGNRDTLKAAIQSLIAHIQDLDAEQDAAPQTGVL